MILLNQNHEEIDSILEKMEKDRDNITKSIIEICFYMRGSITWDIAWDLSLKDIKFIKQQIKKNIETTSKTGIPVI